MKNKLLVGKPGVGKTYTAEQYALQNDMYFVEYNASDSRNALSLKDLSLLQTRTVSGKKIMYLFDEVDNMEKGGAKKLTEFLKGNNNMVIFLTANNLDKVHKEIQKECEIEIVNPKKVNEMINILKDIFPDMLGFDLITFEKLAEEASRNSKGDLRKAQQLMQYQNTKRYSSEKLDNINAIKMILYDTDRKKVYNYIRQISISSLYSWLFETFAINKDKEGIKLMQEINRNLYKINEIYLYSFIAFELPARKNNLIIRLPTLNKLPKIELNIVDKLKEHYKCGEKEALQYLNLLKSIDSYCKEKVADKCQFTKMENEHLGIETKIERKNIIKEQKIETSSLLQY